uniref:ATP synthase complex subunit 8 n=1 Tax=Tenualosa thibaudeaui TaxID=691798 RepID=H1UCI9_9TELE|nr:ATPase subunits 8 [Tenualosa thibaudeaui]BAL43860.1 ATPase subunits 8 [Tenualosa thibaudeaui]
MPQLNPAPWFAILVFSWFIFLTMVPQKVLTIVFNNEPTPGAAEKAKPGPWSWPWH